MTDRAELDLVLRAFFVDGTDELADRVIDGALDQIDHTGQRPASRLPRRLHVMPMLTRLAAAAVIGVIAIGGALLVTRPAIVGDPRQTTTPPSPTAPPTPQPSASSGIPALTGALGVGRQIHTATVLADGTVLLVGGYDNEDRELASGVVYDPGTDTFNATGSLADARGYHTATLLSDARVLVVGGGPPGWPGSINGITGPFLVSAELYDPPAGAFTATGSLATPRENATATLLGDGRVLITGGADYQSRAVATAELFDPTTGTFNPTGSMMTARAFHTATLLSDGRVLIVGGSPAAWGTTEKLATTEIYDPRAGTFTASGSMAAGREFHTATRLGDGRVLIAGGDTTFQDVTATAEIYDPTTGTFSPTGSMAARRTYHTATLLADGRVLLTGGGGDYATRHFLAYAELFDPTIGTFTATGSMADPRTYHTATLLGDGRVLVAGGYGALAPLASAEIYDPATGTFNSAGLGG